MAPSLGDLEIENTTALFVKPSMIPCKSQDCTRIRGRINCRFSCTSRCGTHAIAACSQVTSSFSRPTDYDARNAVTHDSKRCRFSSPDICSPQLLSHECNPKMQNAACSHESIWLDVASRYRMHHHAFCFGAAKLSASFPPCLCSSSASERTVGLCNDASGFFRAVLRCRRPGDEERAHLVVGLGPGLHCGTRTGSRGSVPARVCGVARPRFEQRHISNRSRL